MKNLFLLSLFMVIAFVSCKKDYTCTCMHYTRQQNHQYSSSEYTETLSHVTKTQANKECAAKETDAGLFSYVANCHL